ncbi:hypothetical protein MKW92_005254, partial [Papaver armeniacum]
MPRYDTCAKPSYFSFPRHSGPSKLLTKINSLEIIHSADVDECLHKNKNNCSATAICNNTIGSYNCFCPLGSFGDGKTDGS